MIFFILIRLSVKKFENKIFFNFFEKLFIDDTYLLRSLQMDSHWLTFHVSAHWERHKEKFSGVKQHSLI